MTMFKTIAAGVATAAMMFTSASVASAIDIRNEDERAYPLTVVSSTMTHDMEMRSLSLSIVVCVGECEFRVPGVGTAKARGSDTVTIRNGRLLVEKATADAGSARRTAQR